VTGGLDIAGEGGVDSQPCTCSSTICGTCMSRPFWSSRFLRSRLPGPSGSSAALAVMDSKCSQRKTDTVSDARVKQSTQVIHSRATIGAA
jgi:hypothetical protein